MKKIITSILVLTSLLSFGQNATVDELSKLYNSKDFKSAIEKAKPLLEKEPNNVDFNLIMGRSLADLGDIKKAVPYLQFVVKNDPNSWKKAWALDYIGTCYFMLQDYGNSKTSLMECIKLNATKNVTNDAYGKALLLGFDEFYNGWKVVETENFRFYFQNMTPEEIEKYILEREAAYKEINGFFKSSLPKKIDFFVWASPEDAQKVLRLTLGFARPNFCLVHTLYKQTIGHEITHVISNYASDKITKTRFINEGTAVCFDLSNSDKIKKVKEWISVNNRQISIKDFWLNGDKQGEEILYPVAGLFVKDLISTFGKEKFLEFFKNQTYENAIIVFGSKLDKLIEDFDRRMNNIKLLCLTRTV